jgi:hypothetical protein
MSHIRDCGVCRGVLSVYAANSDHDQLNYLQSGEFGINQQLPIEEGSFCGRLPRWKMMSPPLDVTVVQFGFPFF